MTITEIKNLRIYLKAIHKRKGAVKIIDNTDRVIKGYIVEINDDEAIVSGCVKHKVTLTKILRAFEITTKEDCFFTGRAYWT